MTFGISVAGSVLLTIFHYISFPSAVVYPVNFKKFSFNAQRGLCCLFNYLFTIAIVIVYLVDRQLELIFVVLVFAQLVVATIYTSVLSVYCRKKALKNIADQIKRLDLDITQDIVELRRKIMADSDISCSIKQLQSVIDLIKRKKL